MITGAVTRVRWGTRRFQGCGDLELPCETYSPNAPVPCKERSVAVRLSSRSEITLGYAAHPRRRVWSCGCDGKRRRGARKTDDDPLKLVLRLLLVRGCICVCVCRDLQAVSVRLATLQPRRVDSEDEFSSWRVRGLSSDQVVHTARRGVNDCTYADCAQCAPTNPSWITVGVCKRMCVARE